MSTLFPEKSRPNPISFDDIFESLPVPIIILDKNGKILMMNRFQEKQSRVNREKVLGTYFHETWYKLFDQVPDYSNKYYKLLRKQIPYSFVFHEAIPQFYDLKLSGIASGIPLLSGKGFILVNEVLEEIKRNKQTLERLNIQLSESTDFLYSLLDSSPNSTIATDKNGFINLVNKTAQQLFGFSKGEFLWRHISNIFEGEPELEDLIKLINKREALEINCRKKNEQMFPARLQVTDIKSKKDKSSSILFIIKDMTYERTMELSLAERLEFEKLLSELSAAFVNLPISEIDTKINHGLKRIGRFLKADRFYMLQPINNSDVYLVSHTWAEEGIEPLPTSAGSGEFPWCSKELLRKKVVRFKTPDDLPHEAMIDKQSFLKFGTRSHLSIPLVVGDSVLGSLSMDQVQSERTWPDDLIQRLKIVCEVFVNVMIRKQSEKTLQEAFLEIKKLKDQREAERNYLREEIKIEHNFENIIGSSQAIKSVLFKVEQVAPTNTTVLILGETGTGKELIARAIHNASERNDSPLIKVNCASLPSNLIESELFGHEKGAFTSAHTSRQGRFELANGATLFLDEIGDLPFELQGKLLRVLQEREFERLGSSHTIKVDVRIIAATNRDLEEEVKKGRFRKDLWYRLNVFPIIVPPLRERKSDIPLLANSLMNNFCKKLGKQIKSISAATMKTLESYPWPGNIRELENIIERSVINTQGANLIIMDKLEMNQEGELIETHKKKLHEVERNYIIQVLEETEWKIEGADGAAAIIGLHPSTLRGRMRKYSIYKPGR